MTVRPNSVAAIDVAHHLHSYTNLRKNDDHEGVSGVNGLLVQAIAGFAAAHPGVQVHLQQAEAVVQAGASELPIETVDCDGFKRSGTADGGILRVRPLY